MLRSIFLFLSLFTLTACPKQVPPETAADKPTFEELTDKMAKYWQAYFDVSEELRETSVACDQARDDWNVAYSANDVDAMEAVAQRAEEIHQHQMRLWTARSQVTMLYTSTGFEWRIARDSREDYDGVNYTPRLEGHVTGDADARVAEYRATVLGPTHSAGHYWLMRCATGHLVKY